MPFRPRVQARAHPLQSLPALCRRSACSGACLTVPPAGWNSGFSPCHWSRLHSPDLGASSPEVFCDPRRAIPLAVAGDPVVDLAAVTSTLVVPSSVRSLGLRMGSDGSTGFLRWPHHARWCAWSGVGMVLGFSRGSCLDLGSRWFRGLGSGLSSHSIWTTPGWVLLFFIIGLADDRFALSPWPRLGRDVVAVAMVVWSQGARIGAADFPGIE